MSTRQLGHEGPPPGAHREIRGIEHLDKVIDIDQNPIGRTPRSNPATYTGAFDFIRELFAQLPEAKVRGYAPGRFSFNVKGGRCEACQGDGLRKIEMHFLPDVFVKCDVCHGRRYNRETLEVQHRGQLDRRRAGDDGRGGARSSSSPIPAIRRKLETLRGVGLGYIHLGQSATTLSGGEAQRVKLASELSRVATGRTLYVLDEPTTGLHFEDVRVLLNVLHALVDRGNTVIVIEHHLDVIKCADWVIDLGPEGGDQGGRVVAAGTPEAVARVSGSHTGAALREVLCVERSNFGHRRATQCRGHAYPDSHHESRGQDLPPGRARRSARCRFRTAGRANCCCRCCAPACAAPICTSSSGTAGRRAASSRR